ncbi:hypothetical protein [Sphingosinicella sp. BN140058]|uniref:hypothetical protein n=1 Tax=Sphingosinicella sp. BN140058 TaxID=1892855 RepID=UPI0010100F4C|nr:hypothetical protein [Sphingosinicella sp. BN140058]QAY76325.1 hypothetical protein ETR14_07110 [Sphingosinicella sp. BN140058]
MNPFCQKWKGTLLPTAALIALPLLFLVRAFAADACVAPKAGADVAQAPAGVDPTASLLSRLRPPSPDAIRSYVDSGAVSARPYLLNAAQRAKVDDALRNLPALHRQKLHAHLRHLSFIDVPAGAGNGLTAVVNDGSFPVFDLTLRAGILNESLAEFLTSKERAIFADDGSGSTVTIDAPANALDYVLLHEATHIVDNVLAVTRKLDPRFTSSIWLDRTSLHPSWAKSPIASNLFRRGPRIPISSAPGLYTSLVNSPFVSLYATAAAPEDFAELVAWREMSKRHRQPLTITVRDNRGAVIHRTQPFDNDRFTRRFAAVDALFGGCAARRR